MANFECKVYKIDSVEEHPNADRLNLVHIKGFTCIANKLEDGSPRYKAGDLVVYIPENALLPQWMMVNLGLWDEEKLKGKLAGSDGNRCKAIRLRGIYSEGILYPVRMNVEFINMDTNEKEYDNMLDYYTNDGQRPAWTPVKEGDDVAYLLGVTKYEPPVPQHMAGDCFGAGDIFYHYDIDSIDKYPDVLKENEEVYVTEKIHGTQTRIQFTLEKYDNSNECFVREVNGHKLYIYIASKGLGDQGICFKSVSSNDNNVYVMAFNDYFKDYQLEFIWNLLSSQEDVHKITFFGETFGNTQDLHYGVKPNEHNLLNFFDVALDNKFMDYIPFTRLISELCLPRVPELYVGPYTRDKIKELTDGKSVYDINQIREGCVIKPTHERYDMELGRVILKSVSQDYKLRKNGTEFN